MQSTSSDRQRPRSERPGSTNQRSIPLIADDHPDNGLVDQIKAVLSPSISADSQGAMPTGEAKDQRLEVFNRYQWLINTILTEDYDFSSDIEDVRQGIFVAICEGWNRKRESDERATEAWIRTVVRNVASKHRRRSKRRPLTGFEPVLFQSIPASIGGEPIVAELIDKECEERLMKSIDKLSNDMRHLAHMRLSDQMTVSQIAVALGCCPRTVDFRLAALRRELRSLAEKDGPGSHTDLGRGT
jgi:RNA polymerase sigma factor (sigma-70 family)